MNSILITRFLAARDLSLLDWRMARCASNLRNGRATEHDDDDDWCALKPGWSLLALELGVLEVRLVEEEVVGTGRGECRARLSSLRETPL